jgi:hypothetical protein
MFQTQVVQKIRTRGLCSITFFSFSKNPAFYEIMWKNMVEPDRSQNTIWRMRIACWLPKATNTHSQYVILFAFPLQQWLCERVRTLRCAYIASVVLVFLTSTL